MESSGLPRRAVTGLHIGTMAHIERNDDIGIRTSRMAAGVTARVAPRMTTRMIAMMASRMPPMMASRMPAGVRA